MKTRERRENQPNDRCSGRGCGGVERRRDGGLCALKSVPGETPKASCLGDLGPRNKPLCNPEPQLQHVCLRSTVHSPRTRPYPAQNGYSHHVFVLIPRTGVAALVSSQFSFLFRLSPLWHQPSEYQAKHVRGISGSGLHCPLVPRGTNEHIRSGCIA